MLTGPPETEKAGMEERFGELTANDDGMRLLTVRIAVPKAGEPTVRLMAGIPAVPVGENAGIADSFGEETTRLTTPIAPMLGVPRTGEPTIKLTAERVEVNDENEGIAASFGESTVRLLAGRTRPTSGDATVMPMAERL